VRRRWKRAALLDLDARAVSDTQGYRVPGKPQRISKDQPGQAPLKLAIHHAPFLTEARLIV
jgi:hypothetical protein